ncbi:MAG: TetR/AcrR family transcriptional regulator [Planctomycetaceae bacterium]|nr:TetR/AcrR family transcriptional regulator [Planctomycetaceae bacterium]
MDDHDKQTAGAAAGQNAIAPAGSGSSIAHHGNRRADILAAAGKAFDAHGYAGTTMDQIASQAGVAKGSLYNYFQSKQDLFLALFKESIASVQQQTDELIGEPIASGEKLRRLLGMWYQDFEHFRSLGALVLEFWLAASREDPQGPMIQAMRWLHRDQCRRIEAIVAQGVQRGEFRDTDPQWAGATVMALLNGLTLQSILGVGAAVDKDFLEALKNGLVASMAAGAPQGSDRQ